MNILKQPGWLRALEIITGTLAMILGILVLIYPQWGVSTLVLLLSIGLVFVGIRSIGVLGDGDIPNSIKALSAITGIICLILAVLVIVFPNYGTATLLYFVSFGLLVHGFGRLFLAYSLKGAPNSIRGGMVAVGVVDVILSIVVVFLPGLALLTLAAVLAVLLLVNGAEMIASGVVGRTWLGTLVEAVKKEVL